MELEWLELKGFRSYRSLTWRPGPGLHVLEGPNGIGKTNILEAIAYLSGLRSFRRTPDEALIGFGSDEAILRAGFRSAASEIRVEISLPRQGRRQVLLNGKRPKRHADVTYQVPMVAFLPDDLDLVKRGPALRREYVDDLVAQMSPTSGADLSEYDRAVRQRNTLLRNEGRDADPAILDVWDERVATSGALVVMHRRDVLERIRDRLSAAYGSVSNAGDALQAEYASKWLPSGRAAAEDVALALGDALVDRRRRDMEQRVTTVGPHRDDVLVTLGTGGGQRRDVRTQASQGEQRSATLALRMAAYELLEAQRGEAPILLLDDVLSELDPVRARGVLELLPRGQVFLTTAREDEDVAGGVRWKVTSGAITT